MRTSLLSRSVIAVATLGIGSAALAVTPANAATASGITRDQVLTAANGLRLADPTSAQNYATETAMRSITARSCGVNFEAGDYLNVEDAYPTAAGDDADGVLLTAHIETYDGTTETTRHCTVAAFASVDPAYQLSGTATVSGQLDSEESPAPGVTALRTAALSGDVFVTPVTLTDDYYNLSATASGNAQKTTSTTTSVKVADRKTKSEKKAAKKKYDSRLKAAKKTYNKALDKAGNSKSKKVKAKKAYSAKKASAKAKYKVAIANFKIVQKTTQSTENRPFSITTVVPETLAD